MTQPARKLTAILLSDVEKEMLVTLARSSDTSICATIRRLIRRECAASGDR